MEVKFAQKLFSTEGTDFMRAVNAAEASLPARWMDCRFNLKVTQTQKCFRFRKKAQNKANTVKNKIS